MPISRMIGVKFNVAYAIFIIRKMVAGICDANVSLSVPSSIFFLNDFVLKENSNWQLLATQTFSS